MKPEDEITAKDGRSDVFGAAPRRSRSVYDVIGERYDIVKQLGAGGMGVVLHVFDRLTEEDVALKLIRPELARRPELVERFKREVRLARKITHKRVCRTYELLRLADTLAISMEYVEGDTLREVLRRFGGLGKRTVIRIAEETCSALEEAHSHTIVHRDLKPENIMLDRDGHVKVMDFGIAHSVAQAYTAPGDKIGTPSYLLVKARSFASAFAISVIASEGIRKRIRIFRDLLSGRAEQEIHRRGREALDGSSLRSRVKTRLVHERIVRAWSKECSQAVSNRSNRQEQRPVDRGSKGKPSNRASVLIPASKAKTQIRTVNDGLIRLVEARLREIDFDEGMLDRVFRHRRLLNKLKLAARGLR